MYKLSACIYYSLHNLRILMRQMRVHCAISVAQSHSVFTPSSKQTTKVKRGKRGRVERDVAH